MSTINSSFITSPDLQILTSEGKLIDFETRTSDGSLILPKFIDFVSFMIFPSVKDCPTATPRDCKIVFAKIPPTRVASDFFAKASASLSFVSTFAPPIIRTSGRLGLSRIAESTAISFSIKKPEKDFKNFGIPTIEACALWDAAKASLTKTSPYFESFSAKLSSFSSSSL